MTLGCGSSSSSSSSPTAPSPPPYTPPPLPPIVGPQGLAEYGTASWELDIYCNSRGYSTCYKFKTAIKNNGSSCATATTAKVIFKDSNGNQEGIYVLSPVGYSTDLVAMLIRPGEIVPLITDRQSTAIYSLVENSITSSGGTYLLNIVAARTTC